MCFPGSQQLSWQIQFNYYWWKTDKTKKITTKVVISMNYPLKHKCFRGVIQGTLLTALRCRWRFLVSWGLSAWPLGRHRPHLRPPAGKSETIERKTFLLWLHQHWQEKKKEKLILIFTVKYPHSDQKKCYYSTGKCWPVSEGLTHRAPQWVRPWRRAPLSPGWGARRCCWWDCLGSANGGRGSVSPPERSRPVEIRREETRRLSQQFITVSWFTLCNTLNINYHLNHVGWTVGMWKIPMFITCENRRYRTISIQFAFNYLQQLTYEALVFVCPGTFCFTPIYSQS